MNRIALLSALVAVVALAQPSAAKDCRAAEAPPGVRMPERAGCKPPGKRDPVKPEAKTGRSPGFIDLGGGAELRIGGSVDMEVRHRR